MRKTRSNSIFWICISAMVLFVVSACRPSVPATQPAESRVRVFVSIPPQKYFVERVGGDRVYVSVMLPPGRSPATYELTPKQMVELAAARTYFRIGVPFEKQVVAKIGSIMKDLPIVDTRKGIDIRKMTKVEKDHKHHPEEHHHHHTELDPHVWMSPRLVKIQAQTICEELCRLDPTHRKQYEKNLRSFDADLNSTDAEIATSLAPLRGREFYVFHPAYGYFAQAYGLEQVAIENSGKRPTAKQLGTLIDRANQANVKLIIVQPQFDKSSAKAVAERIGGVVVPVDPLAEDYLDNLRSMATTIRTALTAAQASEPTTTPAENTSSDG